MKQVSFSPNHVNVYLEHQGERKSLADATHLVLKAEGRLAVIRENPEHWFQPMGFRLAQPGQPWFLFGAWELGVPMFLRHELIRVIVEILDLCGWTLGEKLLDGESDVCGRAVLMGGNDQLKLAIRRHQSLRVGNGIQVMLYRKDSGRITVSLPTPGAIAPMVTRYVTSPYFGPLDDLQWELWVLHITELFMLGGVYLTPLFPPNEQNAVFQASLTSTEASSCHPANPL